MKNFRRWVRILKRLNTEDTSGIVSGGKTQKQIDEDMKVIADKHSKVFKGMGRAKVDPIHIQMKG